MNMAPRMEMMAASVEGEFRHEGRHDTLSVEKSVFFFFFFRALFWKEEEAGV